MSDSIFDKYDMNEIDRMAANIAFAHGLRWSEKSDTIEGFGEHTIVVTAHSLRLAAIAARRVLLPEPDALSKGDGR